MEQVGIAVNDISLANWNVSGPFADKDREDLKLDLNTELKTYPKFKQLHIINSISYYYGKNPDHKILSGKVITAFDLQIDKSHIKKNLINIPDSANITMLSIAISHARAIFHSQAKASGLQGFILPIVNPTEIFNRIKESLESKNQKAN